MTARKTTRAKPKPRRVTKPESPTEGAKLIAALSRVDDPYEVTMLIREAADVADYRQRLRELLNGDRQAWLEVKIGAKTVEVVVSNPLREARAQADQLRKLVAEIRRLRSDGGDPDEDDVLDDGDD